VDQAGEFNVTCQKVRDVLICHVEADEISTLDHVDQLTDRFKQLLEEHRPAKILIDLQGVRFMATAAVNVLLVVMKRVRLAGGEICLEKKKKNVQQMFELMQLKKIFTVYDNRRAALDALEIET